MALLLGTCSSGSGSATGEGLDNMTADLAAVRAETYGESAGSYKIAATTAVLGEEICQ